MGFVSSWDQLTSGGEQSLSIFLFPKDVFYKSETIPTPGSQLDRAWERVADQSHLFCAFSTGPLLSLGAIMNLTNLGIVYGDMQSMAAKWSGVFLSLKRQRA